MIRRLLTFWFSLFVVSFLLMGVVFVVISNRAAGNFSAIANLDAPVLITMSQIQAAATRLQVEALSVASLIVASEDPVALDWDALRAAAAETPADEDAADEQAPAARIEGEAIQFLVAANTLSGLLDTYAGLADGATSEIIAAQAPLERAALAVQEAGQALIDGAMAGNDPTTYFGALEAAEGQLETIVNETMALEQGQLEALAGTVLRNVNVFTVVALVVTFGIAGLAFLGARTGGKMFIDNVDKMEALANAVEAGDLSVRSDAKGPGEIGHMQRAFNGMLDTIQLRDRELAAVNEQLAERIIETEEARAIAERSNQVKSAFLANMSHELRTPLNAVINFTRFVLDGDTGPINDQQAEMLSEVVSSGRHLLNLINDVLDMSKIEAGSLNLFIEDNVGLESMLKGLETTARSLLADKPVTLHMEIDPDLPPMRADRQRILQILLNLVSNACKFTEEGAITLRAAQRDGEICVEVEDTGPGIAPDDQALVFEAFKQTKTGLRQAGGTGLGMPIARSLAEAHGGRLWLESQVGQGTTFYVTLPLESVAEAVAVA